jgi:hypothetical protein
MAARCKTFRCFFSLMVLVAFFCMSMAAGAGSSKSSSAPAKSAPAKATSSAKPAAGSGSKAQGGSSLSSGAHAGTSGPSANHPASSGPSANHPAANAPSANSASANHPGGPSAPNRVGSVPQRPGPTAPTRTAPIARTAPRNSVDNNTRDGSAVRTRSNGRVSDVHDARRGMEVHHGLDGSRRVSVERADHSRVVSERGRPGYVQRPFGYRGHDFERRSYFYHGRAYNRFYRGYGYRGMYLNVYAPGFYFGPGFYGWAYNPWAMPITFGWEWGASPWYGYYGGYFAPYRVYPSASYWLTDYMISTDLEAAYAARQDAGEVAASSPVSAGGTPTLSPETKQMIADEVRDQLALENQEAQQNTSQQDADPNSSGIGRMLSDGRPHVFVAGGSLDVVDNSGAECLLSEGDALSLRTPPAPDATQVNLQVLASKGGQECAKSSTVTVGLTDLQEMQNHMRETIDQGLQELQAKQGKGGLPAAPPSAQSQPVPALYASAAPAPENDVAAQIQHQTQQADQAETEVTAAVSQQSGVRIAVVPVAPATVALGQTAEEVKAALGAPARIADLGNRVIFYYNGMKVTLKEGKVTDVQ